MNQEKLLDIITDGQKFDGAYNIRINGKVYDRKTNEFVNIESMKQGSGLEIYVKDNTKGQTIGIPVLLTSGDITETVLNHFYIGKDCDITIIAGCGIDNCSSCTSQHDGIHTFDVGENSKVKYIERHYGDGEGSGKRIMNPKTIVNLQKNSKLEMVTTQIQGVDETKRETIANLMDGANLVVTEKVQTSDNQKATSIFDVSLNGVDSKAKLVSRVVAKDQSSQDFISDVKGNNKCYAHVECDAIIVNNAKVASTPKIVANHPDASLVHEATIGKIAGEQLMKLLSLGLDEKQAEEVIISGFLR